MLIILILGRVMIQIGLSHLNLIEKLFSCVIPYYDLEKRISSITQNNLPLTANNIQDLKKAFSISNYRIFPLIGLKKTCSQISEAKFREFLDHFSEDDDVVAYLEYFLAKLKDSSLLTLAGFKTVEEASNLVKAQNLLKKEALLGLFEKEGRIILGEFKEEAVKFLHNLFRMFIALTGLSNLNDTFLSPNQERINKYIAKDTFKMYWNLVLSPTIIFTFFLKYLDTATAIAITAIGCALIVSSVVLYSRYYKLCPSECYGLKNMKTSIQKDDFIYTRIGVLKQIESAFSRGKGVLLIGDSGSGKTFVIRSLATEIEASKICQFIKKPQFFWNSAARFASAKSNSSFEMVENNLIEHSKEVIFFFEEFASFFNGEGIDGASSGNEIKTFLDQFHYVIGATTTDEYNKYIKGNKTIDERRFKIIKLNQMEIKEIEMALSHQLHQKHPEIDLETNVLNYIALKAKMFNSGTSEIDAATSLLKRAMLKLTEVSFDELDSELSALETERAHLEQQLLHNLQDVTNLTKNYKFVLEKIESQTALQSKKNKQLQGIKKLEAIYLRFKKKRYSLSASVKNEFSSAFHEWLKNEAMFNMMSDFVQKKRTTLGLPACLNQALVDSILEESDKEQIKPPMEVSRLSDTQRKIDDFFQKKA